jgi:hypothetical protein
MADFWIMFWPLWLVLLIVLILLLFKKYSKKGGLSRRVRYGIVLVASVTGFLLSVFSNSISEADFFSKLDLLNISLEHRGLSKWDEKFNQFYKENVIFIDNFYSRDLERGVTRRDLLADLLKELRKGEQDLDLILLDILFIDTVIGEDESLISEILFFAEKGKIALANDVDPKFQFIRDGLTEKQLGELYGEVNFRSKEGISFYQYLYFDSTYHLARKPSLPYLCYKKLNPIQGLSNDHLIGDFVFNKNNYSDFYSNHFITPHFINDRTIYSGVVQSSDEAEMDSFLTMTYNYWDLNDCLDSLNIHKILEVLRERKVRNESMKESTNRNIIVIGSVLDNNDLHQTPFGRVYGIEILLNGLIYMQLGILKEQSTYVLVSFVIFLFFSILMYSIKRYSENYIFKEFKLKYLGTLWYLLVKCSDELVFMLTIIFWVYWTQNTLFAFNFFFPMLVVLLSSKAVIIVENSQIKN